MCCTTFKDKLHPTLQQVVGLDFLTSRAPVRELLRHGICHGHTDIVRVNFYLPWVKYGFEHTPFVVDSFSNPFVVIFCGPMKQKQRKIGIKVCIESDQGNIWVKYNFFFSKKVVIYEKFWGKTFPKTRVRVKFVTNSMSGIYQENVFYKKFRVFLKQFCQAPRVFW